MKKLVLLIPPGLGSGEDVLANRTLTWRFDGEEGVSTLDELAATHPEAEVQLVLSAADVLVSEVTLSRRQARHIQKVLPFLLEEQLIGPADQQWFAHGKRENDHFGVAVIERAALQSLLEGVSATGLRVASAVVDALEVQDQAPIRIAAGEQTLFVLPDGALSVPASQADDTAAILAADDGAIPDQADGQSLLSLIEAHSAPSVELLHGELKPKRKKERTAAAVVAPQWRSTLVLAASLLLLAWVLVGVQAWTYQRAADEAESRAVALYEKLFPGDRALRLRAQFKQRLDQSAGGGGGGGFTALITSTGEAMAFFRSQGLQPKRLQYDERQGQLLLELTAPSFDALEALQSRIRENGFTVEITNYRNQGEQVTARMEVTS